MDECLVVGFRGFCKRWWMSGLLRRRFAAMGFQHFTVAKEGKDLSTESYAVAIILSRDRMAISLFGRYGCFCSDNRWLYSVVVRCNDDRAAVRASSVI